MNTYSFLSVAFFVRRNEVFAPFRHLVPLVGEKHQNVRHMYRGYKSPPDLRDGLPIWTPFAYTPLVTSSTSMLFGISAYPAGHYTCWIILNAAFLQKERVASDVRELPNAGLGVHCRRCNFHRVTSTFG